MPTEYIEELPIDARFQAACHAMQGLLAHGNWETSTGLAAEAARLADALLAELNKGREA